MSDLAVIDALPDGAGAIGLFSSDEFMPGAIPFDRALLEATGPNIAVLFCADHRNAELNARHAAAHFGALGARAWPLPIEHNPARLTGGLPEFDLLYMPGGSPADLLSCLHGSDAWEQILARWRDGAGLAGSSAGAMALCAHCMIPRPGDVRPTTWGSGLGPIQHVGLAVHASSRPDGWMRGMAEKGVVPLLAIEDSTGVLLRPGQAPLTVGPGTAYLVTKRAGN